MNITDSDVELPVKVSYLSDRFGVVITGVALQGFDVIHLMTDGQIESERWKIEQELKRNAEDSKASDSYYNSLDRAEFDYQTANRRL